MKGPTMTDRTIDDSVIRSFLGKSTPFLTQESSTSATVFGKETKGYRGAETAIHHTKQSKEDDEWD